MAGRGDPLRGAASGGQAAQDRGRGAALQGGRPAYTREPAAKDQGEEEAEGGQEEKVSRACLGWLGWAGVTGGGGRACAAARPSALPPLCKVRQT